MPSSTLSDRLLTVLKNNRYVAVIFVAATIICAVAQFTGALDQIIKRLGRDGRVLAIYQPLYDNLYILEHAMNVLGTIHGDGTKQVILIPHEVRYVVLAAELVCKARQSVSELGDTDTRQRLDTICTTVQTIATLGQHTEDGLGARALSNVTVQFVTELREKLHEFGCK